MGFHRSLEEEYRYRTFGVGLDFNTCRGDRCRHVAYERADISEEFHQTAHRHVLGCGQKHYRIYRTVRKSFAYAFAHLVFCEASLFEEFLHKCLVVLGRGFNENLVEFAGLVKLVGGNVADGRNSSVRTPFIFLHKKNIDHGVEALA